MSLIKKFVKHLGLLAILSSSHLSYASDILVDTTIHDASSDLHGGWRFKVDSMDVLWTSNGDITVDVYTNFVDYNNRITSGGQGNIVFGDLLLGTDGLEDNYNYAFNLTDGRYDNFYLAGHDSNIGQLNAIGSTTTAKQYHGQQAWVQNGPVLGNAVGQSLNQGAWTVDTQYASVGFDKLSFNFNVSGIAAFQNASQLSLSWAMSCANDIVSGVVAKVNTQVSEPAAALLMLLGFGAIGLQRKKMAKT